jgi:hypothetical protein
MSDITLTAEEAALVVEALRGYAAYANKRDGDRMAQLSHKLESVPQPRPTQRSREAAMAERAPKLEWSEYERVPRNPSWRAWAGPIRLTVMLRRGYTVVEWEAEGYDNELREGVAESVEAAQLAAESAALAWLTEGVTALGGRALTSDQVALCVEALNEHGDYLTAAAPSSDEDVAETEHGAAMLQLARELEGGGA